MTPLLPVEVWLDIFRWATLAPQTCALDVDYHPFSSSVTHNSLYNISVLQRICLVCKQWWRWNIALLYEDVRIPALSIQSSWLLSMLQSGKRSSWGDGITIPPCARFVRRAHLPFSSTSTSTSAKLAVLAILELSSSLEVLIRDAYSSNPGLSSLSKYDFTIDCPPLPSLLRLDWWHSNKAAPTGGINFLPHVLAAAPNLRYLSVGGEMWVSSLATAPAATLVHLTTLHLRRVNALLLFELARCTLPALRHIVTDTVPVRTLGESEALGHLWAAFGAQLRTVELGPSLQFWTELDVLDDILVGCPRLSELCIFALFVHAPTLHWKVRTTMAAHGMLETVHMNLRSNLRYLPSECDEEYWTHLSRHFAVLGQAGAFPALKRVVLYEANGVVLEDEFRCVTQPLRERGCTFEEVS